MTRVQYNYHELEETEIVPSKLYPGRHTIFVKGFKCPFCNKVQPDMEIHSSAECDSCGSFFVRKGGRLDCERPDSSDGPV